MSMTANLDSQPRRAQFPATDPVFDSLGATHNVTVPLRRPERIRGAIQWRCPLRIILPTECQRGNHGNDAFDPTGKLTTITPAGGAAETVGTAAGDVSSIALNFNNPLTDGANNLNMQWNMLGSAGLPSISQINKASGLSGVTANGNAAGTCTGFTIGSDGTVTSQYTSGTEDVGQVALANMTNLQGLRCWVTGITQRRWPAARPRQVCPEAADWARCRIRALEASNVNISSEFSDLIVAQRAFEANAKSVTTFDTVTQDTINMVH